MAKIHFNAAHFLFFKGKIMANIKMYTTTWCGDCRSAKRFMREHAIDFEEINIEEAEGAAEFVMSVNNGRRKVPTFEIDGRTFNLSPYDERKLRAELGL
jgi:mycoredoxin